MRVYKYLHKLGKTLTIPALVVEMAGGPEVYFNSPYVEKWWKDVTGTPIKLRCHNFALKQYFDVWGDTWEDAKRKIGLGKIQRGWGAGNECWDEILDPDGIVKEEEEEKIEQHE